ncbi:hypothetical protein DEO72_LG5g1449 [Vigna unguiculata]|uniref:Uncharacterized protein n=1 Tax=Vigna unguiculata TaxID=3917 RepID=A0A4D6LZW9_VIGUN|nr:hypothetical protein DEO72_LG5g1449 [Vigna unguiculata]
MATLLAQLLTHSSINNKVPGTVIPHQMLTPSNLRNTLEFAFYLLLYCRCFN